MTTWNASTRTLALMEFGPRTTERRSFAPRCSDTQSSGPAALPAAARLGGAAPRRTLTLSNYLFFLLLFFFGNFITVLKYCLAYRISSRSVHTQKWVRLRFCTYETLQCTRRPRARGVSSMHPVFTLIDPQFSVGTILLKKQTKTNTKKKQQTEFKKFHPRDISIA